MQNLNMKRIGFLQKLQKKQAESRKMLRVTLPILLAVVLDNRGHIYFEWPTRCRGWQVVELMNFLSQLKRAGVQVFKCIVHGCAYGLRSDTSGRFLEKSWTILTTDEDMYHRLARRCPKNHQHEVIQGRQTARSAFYPPAMGRQVALIWRETLAE